MHDTVLMLKGGTSSCERRTVGIELGWTNGMTRYGEQRPTPRLEGVVWGLHYGLGRLNVIKDLEPTNQIVRTGKC
jgi:hypothetical protein